MLLDLAPPADHVAGRWALALVVVGYVAGRVRPEPAASARGQPTATAVVTTVAASSFVGTSVYAISGLLLQDPVVSIGDLLPVILAERGLGRAAHAARAAGADAAARRRSSRAGPTSDGARQLDHGSQRGRLRVLVIQALVFALFATLFVRLYYLQVVSGETYHARAASQSLRDIVVQPERGLIVDDQGRPLVANRTSWVVSLDRTLLGKLGEHGSEVVVKRLAGVLDMRPARIRAKLVVVR